MASMEGDAVGLYAEGSTSASSSHPLNIKPGKVTDGGKKKYRKGEIAPDERNEMKEGGLLDVADYEDDNEKSAEDDETSSDQGSEDSDDPEGAAGERSLPEGAKPEWFTEPPSRGYVERFMERRRDKTFEAIYNGQGEVKREKKVQDALAEIETLIVESRSILFARADLIASLDPDVLDELRSPIRPIPKPPLDRMDMVIELIHAIERINHVHPTPRGAAFFRLLQTSVWTQDLVLRLIVDPWLVDLTRHPACQVSDESEVAFEKSVVGMEIAETTRDGADSDADGSEEEDPPIPKEHTTVLKEDVSSGLLEGAARLIDADSGEGNGAAKAQEDLFPRDDDKGDDSEDFEDEGDDVSITSSAANSTEECRQIHYIRNRRVPLGDYIDLVKRQRKLHPADEAHLDVKIIALEALTQQAGVTADTLVNDLYIGATIAVTEVDRKEDDEGLAGGASKLLHSIKLLAQYPATCYRLPALTYDLVGVISLDYGKDLSPSQLWQMTPDCWTIEQGLITSVSRECSQNSAYGGLTILRFQLAEQEEIVWDQIRAECSSNETAVATDTDKDLETWMLKTYKEEQAVFSALKQKPIRRTAGTLAAHCASAASYLPNGRVLRTVVAKDITLSDALTKSSWYGDIRGPAPQLDQHVRCESLSESDIPLTLKKDKARIAARHGAFLDFWSTCLLHLLVRLALCLLLRKLLRLRPMVVEVHSAKVTFLFETGEVVLRIDMDFGALLGADDLSTPAVIRRIKNILKRTKDIKWKGLKKPVGDFVRHRVGIVRSVRYGTADGPCSVMVTNIHYGFDRYRPALQWRIYRLHRLIAALTRLAELATLEITQGGILELTEVRCDEAVAMVQTRAEAVGLTGAIAKLKVELGGIIHGLNSLSQLSGEKTEEQLVERNRIHSERNLAKQKARFAKELHAYGSPASSDRREQLAWYIQQSAVVCPGSIEPKSEDWQNWFLALKEGVCARAVAMSSGVQPEKRAMNLVKARKELAIVRDQAIPTFETFSGHVSIGDIFLYLCSAANVRPSNMIAGKGWRWVHCRVCGREGIVGPQAKHGCGQDKWTSISAANSQFTVEMIVFPRQLLAHPILLPRIVGELEKAGKMEDLELLTVQLDSGEIVAYGALLKAEAETAPGQIYREAQNVIGKAIKQRLNAGAPVRLTAGLFGLDTDRELSKLYDRLVKSLTEIQEEE